MAEPEQDALVAELRALGEWLDVPAPRDLRASVRARLAAPPRARRRWRVLAAALVVAILVAVVPPARAAVAHAVTAVLDFAGIQVRQGNAAPAPTPSPLPGVRSAALDRARQLAHFPVGVPAALGIPDDVQLADPGPDGAPRVVSLLYRGGTVRLDEFDGTLDLAFVKSQPQPDSQFVQVRDFPAMWLPTPHAIEYVDRDGVVHHETARSAGPTLVWTDSRVTYRLEGLSTVDDALAVARTTE